MALNSNERLQEAFSLALEDRSKGYQDLVSNSNVLLHTMKKNGQFKEFSGPTIRERLLFAESGTYIRYAGFQYLNPKPAELFGDAEFTPRQAAVNVSIAGDDLLKNSGKNQLLNLFDEHVNAAEAELQDKFVEDMHADGTAQNQIGGLQLVIPTNPALGTYGGISRADFAQWRPGAYDAQSAFAGVTQVNASTIKKIMDQIMIKHSRGKRGPNLILMSQEHYLAYTEATVAIQRIQNESELGGMGFTSLKYYGSGRSVDVVLEGGIGSAMPANTTYFIDTKALNFRYHPERNFKAFGGKRVPVNQDAIVQHIGFMGNITMSNPLHMAKLFDSNPAA